MAEPLTKFEERLYNTFLYVSRSSRNKPVSLRKDFSDFKEEDAFHLKRVANFLNRFPHVKPELFFKAPYTLYPDQQWFGLNFFSGMPAVKTYTLYMKQRLELPVDHPEQLAFLAESLVFIGGFCARQKIALSDYPRHKTGVTVDWMKHLKNHQISVYTLMEFPGIYEVIREVPEDERDLFLGDVGNNFFVYKERYLKSTQAKELLKQGLKKIVNVLSAPRHVDKADTEPNIQNKE